LASCLRCVGAARFKFTPAPLLLALTAATPFYALAQYPHEREILFAPLTGLEVQSTHVDGVVMVVAARISVNLTSLTIEQVIGKRKKMLSDMVPGLHGELRAQLTTLSGEGVEFLLGKLEARLEAGPLAHEAEWYNQDEQLSHALDEMLKTRSGLLIGGNAFAEEARSLEAATREQYGMSISVLRSAGYSCEALLSKLRFDVSALKEAGFDARALKEAGAGAGALKAGGFDARAVVAAGFDASEMVESFGILAAAAAGVSVTDGIMDAVKAGMSDKELLTYAVKEVAEQRWFVSRVAKSGASAAVVNAMLAASEATSIEAVRTACSARTHAREWRCDGVCVRGIGVCGAWLWALCAQVAFKECSRLSEVTVPSSVTSIGDVRTACGARTRAREWRWCDGVCVRGIGMCGAWLWALCAQAAFCGCSSLREVTVPSSVTDIGGVRTACGARTHAREWWWCDGVCV
jgi:hypothetical protein